MESGSILDEMEIQEIISMLTPNEVRDAQEKLKAFLKEYSVIGLERTVVLAYLIGEKSGLYANTDVSAADFAERLRQIYRMGKKHGFTEATRIPALGHSRLCEGKFSYSITGFGSTNLKATRWA